MKDLNLKTIILCCIGSIIGRKVMELTEEKTSVINKLDYMVKLKGKL